MLFVSSIFVRFGGIVAELAHRHGAVDLQWKDVATTLFRVQLLQDDDEVLQS